MYIKLVILSSLLTLMLSKCKDGDCSSSSHYTVENKEGMDGCDWVFVDTAGKIYQPMNLNEHLDIPQNGMSVLAQLKVEEGVMSICMMGEVVTIECLEEKL